MVLIRIKSKENLSKSYSVLTK